MSDETDTSRRTVLEGMVTPATGVTAAIGNAVHHAIGHNICRDLPVTQDKVLAAVKRKA